MSVEIDMKMPSKCEFCFFCESKEFSCMLRPVMDIWTIGHKDRPNWCPLKEVK